MPRQQFKCKLVLKLLLIKSQLNNRRELQTKIYTLTWWELFHLKWFRQNTRSLEGDGYYEEKLGISAQLSIFKY